MDSGTFFAIAASLITAGCFYYLMEYRLYGERQTGMKKVLQAKADTAAVRKELEGHTKYLDYLPAAKQALAERMKLLTVRITRDYVYTETFQKEPMKLKAVVTVIVHYAVEYSLGFNVKLESFDILPSADGVEIRIPKPSFPVPPRVIHRSHEMSIEDAFPDANAIVASMQHKLPPIALKNGLTIANEDANLALCERSLVEAVRSFLSKQAGVKHVPAIAVAYK